MKQTICRTVLGLACASAFAGLATSGTAHAEASLPPIVAAVVHGDCEKAISLANQGVSAKDAHTIFLAGRMLDDGGCVEVDREAAARYFAAAASLGDPQAALEQAASVGMGGAGAKPDLAAAGALCRAAGLDKSGKYSDYALGYVCTVRREASRNTRLALSPGDIALAGAKANVQFNASSKSVRVLSTPSVIVRDDEVTGSMIRRSRVNLPNVVETGIEHAVEALKAVDKDKLSDQPVELVLDLDMSLRINSGDVEHSASNDPRLLLRTNVPGSGGSMASGKVSPGN